MMQKVQTWLQGYEHNGTASHAEAGPTASAILAGDPHCSANGEADLWVTLGWMMRLMMQISPWSRASGTRKANRLQDLATYSVQRKTDSQVVKSPV